MIDFLNKIKKNGVLRLSKIYMVSFFSIVRGGVWWALYATSKFPNGLRVHSGVRNTVRHLRIGKNVSIGFNCSFGGLGIIELSDYVVLNRNTSIDSSLSVKINKRTLIGPDCYFVDSNHSTNKEEILVSERINSKSIVIGENVWIGRGVTILSGVNVGDHAIIGAGAVVSNDIPSETIAVGIPAKVIRKREIDHPLKVN